jgi:hypothetical protein
LTENTFLYVAGSSYAPVASINCPLQILTALTIPPNEPTERETNDSPQRERERSDSKRTENCRRVMESSSAAAASRPPSFAFQTNALLRKNLIFQV